MSFDSDLPNVFRKMDAAAEAALEEVLINAEGVAKLGVSGGGSSPDMLNVRSGDLIGSIDHDIERNGMSSVGRVGANTAYAAIHEFGGTITARNAPYLSFPTPDGGWAMVQSVTIPQRPYIRPSVMDRLGQIERAFARQLGRRMT